MTELSTAARVRDWVINEAVAQGPFWRFSQKDVIKALGLNDHQISAALSSMRKRGALMVVGRLTGPGKDKRGTLRALVYETGDLTVLDGLPRRPSPKSYSKHTQNGFASPRLVGLPEFRNSNAVSNPEPAPKPQLRAVDDLLMVSISLEEQGPTREIGLRLLKIAERIFKEA